MSLNIVNTVLELKPPEWEYASYDSVVYRLFELEHNDDEYVRETQILFSSRLEIKSFKRVQSPFQYGAFLLRKEQLQYRGEANHVVKLYHCVHKSDLEKALQWNLDVRRYSYKTSGNSDQYNNKNPKFHSDPNTAAESVNFTEKVLIICNVLRGYGSGTYIADKTNTEFYPVYVAEL